MIIKNHIIDRAILVNQALQNNEATEVEFGTLTYTAFCSGIAASFDLRADYEQRLSIAEGVRQEINNADAQTATYVQRMVDAIRSHPDYGPNSALYVQCGYVALNQRRSGLTRISEEDPDLAMTSLTLSAQ